MKAEVVITGIETETDAQRSEVRDSTLRAHLAVLGRRHYSRQWSKQKLDVY